MSETCGHNCHLLRTGCECSPCKYKPQNTISMDNNDIKIFQYEVRKLMKNYGISDFIVLADDNNLGMIQMCETTNSESLYTINNVLTQIFEEFSASSEDHT